MYQNVKNSYRVFDRTPGIYDFVTDKNTTNDIVRYYLQSFIPKTWTRSYMKGEKNVIVNSARATRACPPLNDTVHLDGAGGVHNLVRYAADDSINIYSAQQR